MQTHVSTRPRAPRRGGLAAVGVAALTAAVAPAGPVFAQAPPASTPGDTVAVQLPAPPQDRTSSEGPIDYVQPIQIFQTAVAPLESEVLPSMEGFRQEGQVASEQIEAGDLKAGIDTVIASLDNVLAHRASVMASLLHGDGEMVEFIEPMLLEQGTYLDERTPPREGFERFDRASQERLVDLRNQYVSATTDRQRASIERRIRSAFRIAEMRARVAEASTKRRAGQARVVQVLQQLSEMLSELTYTSSDAFELLSEQRAALVEIRGLLEMQESVDAMLDVLNEAFGEGGIMQFIEDTESVMSQIEGAVDSEHIAPILDFDGSPEARQRFETTLLPEIPATLPPAP